MQRAQLAELVQQQQHDADIDVDGDANCERSRLGKTFVDVDDDDAEFVAALDVVGAHQRALLAIRVMTSDAASMIG